MRTNLTSAGLAAGSTGTGSPENQNASHSHGVYAVAGAIETMRCEMA